MTRQARTWATPAQMLQVAKWLLANDVTESKSFLEQSKYVVRLGGVEVNVDYRAVDAMIYALSSVAPQATTAKPKRKAKAQPSIIE